MRFQKFICLLAAICLLGSLLSLSACQENAADSTASTESTGIPPVSSTAKPTGSSTAPTEPAPTEPKPTEPVPTETQPLPSVPADPAGELGRIGLAHLLSQSNGDAMAALYYQVEAAVPALQQELPVENMNLQELTMVLNCYRQDHPESFWFSSKFQYSTFEGKLLSVTLLYQDSDPGSVQFGRDLVDSTVEELLGLLTEDMGDYDKALTLYDALIDRCSYVTDAPNAHNIYGALVDGEAVCEGYALAYQYLLMRAGIPAMYVTGYSREDHAWNAMQLDGQWYYADATWDDPKGNDGTFRYYGHFALTREMMDWDHEAYEDVIPLPEADCMDCNYYHRIDHLVSDFDREQVMQWMKEDNILRVFVHRTPEDYLQELLANINGMVIEADLPWHGYIYTINDREIIVLFY